MSKPTFLTSQKRLSIPAFAIAGLLISLLLSLSASSLRDLTARRQELTRILALANVLENNQQQIQSLLDKASELRPSGKFDKPEDLLKFLVLAIEDLAQKHALQIRQMEPSLDSSRTDTTVMHHLSIDLDGSLSDLFLFLDSLLENPGIGIGRFTLQRVTTEQMRYFCRLIVSFPERI